MVVLLSGKLSATVYFHSKSKSTGLKTCPNLLGHDIWITEKLMMTHLCKIICVFIQLVVFSTTVCAQAKPGTEEVLSKPSGEFLNAQAEHERIQLEQSKIPLRFQLEFYSAIKDRGGKPEVSKVNWDGESLLVDSDRFVYVSTPYRAFLLVRDSRASPLSIQFISPISATVRTVEEIIQFDLKVGDGYVAASRPTEMRRYYCQLGMYTPRKGASIDRAIRTQDGLIRFEFQRTAEPDDFLIREHGICTVDPGQGYSVISAEMNMVCKRPSSNGVMASQFEYYPATGSLPQLIKSYKHQQIKSIDKTKNSIYQQYYYSDYAFEPMPKEKLTLEYYGLPDPMTSPTKFWGWPAALIGAGVLAIIIFMVIRYRRRRGHE